jgi:hypothetical protein
MCCSSVNEQLSSGALRPRYCVLYRRACGRADLREEIRKGMGFYGQLIRCAAPAWLSRCPPAHQLSSAGWPCRFDEERDMRLNTGICVLLFFMVAFAGACVTALWRALAGPLGADWCAVAVLPWSSSTRISTTSTRRLWAASSAVRGRAAAGVSACLRANHRRACRRDPAASGAVVPVTRPHRSRQGRRARPDARRAMLVLTRPGGRRPS